MLITPIPTREVCKILRTGQVTSYVDYDDAWYANLGLGIAKSYLVLTTGQFSGTSTIKLAHYTSAAGAITFSDALDTIVDTGNGLAIFKTNDVIYTNTPNNLGPFTVTTGNVAGTITCVGTTFTSETPIGAVTFYKRELHSNACVLDNNTGLMWSQTVAGKMGTASDGKLPWTTVSGYGIYPYRLAANTALLGGFGDWRVPNRHELVSLINIEDITGVPDTVAFPTWVADPLWTNSTFKRTTAAAWQVRWELTKECEVSYSTKTVVKYCILVRGG